MNTDPDHIKSISYDHLTALISTGVDEDCFTEGFWSYDYAGNVVNRQAEAEEEVTTAHTLGPLYAHFIGEWKRK